MIRLFLVNLELYNEGEIVGDWVELPIRLDNNEEYIINDYQTDIEGLRIGKHDSIQELSELEDEYDNLSIKEQLTIRSIMEWEYYSDIKDAIYNVNNFVLIEGITNDEEYGNYIIENNLMGETPPFLVKYIDVESLGSDTYSRSENYYSDNGLISRRDLMNIY